MSDIYDESTPPDSQKVKLGAQRLRELTENVEDTLGVDHIVDSTDEGMHKKVTIGKADVPDIGIVDKIILYGGDVDSVAELHTMDEGDDIIQYSSQGNLCVTNTKQPAAGEANKILLYAEDNGDSKAKLMTIDEDDNVTPLEGYVLLDSDATVRTTTSYSFVTQADLIGTFTGTAGEIYECLIIGKFQAASVGLLTMVDANSRGDFSPFDGTWVSGTPYHVIFKTATYFLGTIHGYLKIASTGTVSLRQYWMIMGGTGYCDNRYMYIKRVI